VELRDRIAKFCNGKPYEDSCEQLKISMMHSLALKVLRRGNLLSHYPSGTPIMLDDREKERIYDEELADTLGCTPTRAAENRRAYDTAWQTLERRISLFWIVHGIGAPRGLRAVD
jgi:superfamily I DNA/RNA helicase